MATPDKNPFVLPGLGQAGATAGNPLFAGMEMMRGAWDHVLKAGGLPGTLGATSVSSQDIEQRIAELRAVEQWLQMNLAMLGSTIQALEVQRTTVSTLNAWMTSMAGSMPGAGSPASAAAPSSLDVALGVPPKGSDASPPSADSSGLFAASAAQSQGASGSGPASKASAPAGGTPGRAGSVPAGHAAMQGWWDMVQNQFNHLAEATAATVAAAAQPSTAGAAQPTGATTAASKKTIAKKAAAKKTVAKKAAAKKTRAGGAATADARSGTTGSAASRPGAKKSAAKKAPGARASRS